MECRIEKVLLSPDERSAYISNLLRLDGLGAIEEKRDAVYCAIPLTGASKDERTFIGEEHDKIKRCIMKADLSIYDPKETGTNPWLRIAGRPQEVYDLDTIQVVTPKFFEFTNVYPSTGAGIEQQKAITYLKIPVIVTKAGVYTSRMSTGARRTILIEYSDAEAQQDEIAGVFKRLRRYEPGIGMCTVHGNTLLGYSDSQAPVCLSGLMEEQFPGLVYNFDKYVTK
jgi:hypothetical protein